MSGAVCANTVDVEGPVAGVDVDADGRDGGGAGAGGTAAGKVEPTITVVASATEDL